MTVYNELVKNNSVILSDYGVKISDIGKVSSIIGLATTAYITVVRNKIPNVSELFRKRDRNKTQRNKETNVSRHLVVINVQIICLMQR